MSQQQPGPSGIQPQQHQTVSPFPAPPEYAEHYSDDAIRAGLALPPPPVPTKFTVFKEEYDLEGVRYESIVLRIL